MHVCYVKSLTCFIAFNFFFLDYYHYAELAFTLILIIVQLCVCFVHLIKLHKPTVTYYLVMLKRHWIHFSSPADSDINTPIYWNTMHFTGNLQLYKHARLNWKTSNCVNLAG